MLNPPIAKIGSKEGKRLLKNILDSRKWRNEEVYRAVARILDDIRKKGDMALFAHTKKYDKCPVNSKTVRIRRETIVSQAEKTAPALKKTIREAAKRIRAYHQNQKSSGFSIKTAEGRLSQIVMPLNRVGVYIPGGHTVYPSTVLMDIIPAQIAGVREIAAVTPPRRGTLDHSIAFVLDLLGITEVYGIGGAQAVGALAYGTHSVPAVDKIVGPGNLYVAIAKKIVFGDVDIDSVAGPSEVVIIADKSTNPSWAALDLLSQAEHGSGDEIAVCVTDSMDIAVRIREELIREASISPVKRVFQKLSSHAIAFFVGADRNECIDLVNLLAPEHLQIMTKTPRKDFKKIRNAAAVFLGQNTPVALGDYFIGTNHVLPTGSAARFASPLGVNDFEKRISVAEISAEGIKISEPHVSRFARAENFIHHAMSVERRVRER